MVIILQETIKYIASIDPRKLEELSKLGEPENKSINDIKYIKINE